MYERAPKSRMRTLPIQRMVRTSEAAPLQAPSSAAALPRHDLASLPVHPSAARDGSSRSDRGNLPRRLKSGIEGLSGVSMDGVRVHYNSPRPAELDALATAQGREIHLAPGQDHYLPHEAWHIVQQAQGRVKPTIQAKGGPPINEDKSLEREADAMGAKAMAGGAGAAPQAHARPAAGQAPAQLKAEPPIQLGRVNNARKLRNTGANNRKPRQRRGTYIIGQHGYKKKEQQRLARKYRIKVTGSTHESEHTVGYEPIGRTSGEKRGKGARARKLEQFAAAYQEVKDLHRRHIGTGTHSSKDKSGFNSEGYRAAQRSLIESGQVGNAIQLNQLGYAFDPTFRQTLTTSEGQAATDSFHSMIGSLTGLTYAQGGTDVTAPVDAQQRAEAHLSRFVAQNRRYPSRAEENDVRKLYGLDLLPDQN